MPCLFVKRFDLAFELDEQRFAFAIYGFVGGDFDPAFRDAILFDIEAFFVIEVNADLVFEDRWCVVWAAWVNRQVVRQSGALCCISHGMIFHDLGLQIKFHRVMHKYLLVLFAIALQPSVWAGWVYFTNNSHGSSDYYYAPVEDKGKVKGLRTVTQLPVDAKVPFHTPKAVVKVMLYNYSSEQSTYEINCQEQSIQLMERIFYRDMVGKEPFITHKSKDTFIQQSNSEFAKQFIKTPLHFDDIRHYRMYEVACK